jgi:hypothetical protein
MKTIFDFLLLSRCDGLDQVAIQCYYLYQMNMTASASSIQSLKYVRRGWESLSCTMNIVCSYKLQLMSHSSTNYNQPDDCLSFGQPTHQRTRRQSPNESHANSPPSFSVDVGVQRAAEFLKKYLQLDEKDLLVIGHRLTDLLNNI